MSVDVELFGQLAPGVPRRQALSLEPPEGDLRRPRTVREVAILLGVEPDEVGLITINGIQSRMEDAVPLDCRLCLFPPISGG